MGIEYDLCKNCGQLWNDAGAYSTCDDCHARQCIDCEGECAYCNPEINKCVYCRLGDILIELKPIIKKKRLKVTDLQNLVESNCKC